jgi:hypothetical protein
MATTTVLKPSLVPAPAALVHYICETWWTCHTAPGSKHIYRERLDSLLSTGQGLSVIPPTVLERLDVVIVPEPGWRGQVPTWFGVPCRIGRVRMWLSILEAARPYREFALLAIFPRHDLEDAPPFVQLGTQFFLEHRAELLLDCSSPTREGRLIIP